MAHRNQKYASPPDGAVLVYSIPEVTEWNKEGYNRNTKEWELGGDYDRIFSNMDEAMRFIEDMIKEGEFESREDFRIYALNSNDRLVVEEYEEMVPVKKWRVVDKSQPAGLI